MEQPSIHSDIAFLNELIAEGKQLLKECLSNHSELSKAYRIEKSSGIALPLSSAIDDWLKKSTDYVVPLFPRRILDSDFSEVQDVHDIFSKDHKIITDNYSTYLRKILDTLQECLSFFHWFDQFNEEKLSPLQRAELNHSALDAYVLYIQEQLIPKLPGLEDGRTTKTAILHLYGRVFSVVYSIVKLNNVRCCQLLVASLRGLLEIYIDMILLKCNLIENGIEKFFSFSELYTFKTAQNLKRIDRELRLKNGKEHNVDKFINDSELKAIITKKLWGKKNKKVPQHWTNKHLEERSRLAKELMIYRDIYYYGNMYVHSGYLKFPWTEEDADFFCAYVYGFSINIFRKSTEILFEIVAPKDSKTVLEESNKIFLVFGHFQVWKKANKNTARSEN